MKKSNSIDDKLEAITYLLDQAMHVVTIIVVAMAIHLLDQPIGYVGWVQNALEKLQFNVNNALSWILALLVIAKPVCITIKKSYTTTNRSSMKWTAATRMQEQ